MEHEITGHSRKVYKIWKNPAQPFWKKVKEIAIEVGIIVFAVSLAALLEHEREHINEQKQAKEFLLGLKTDLQKDIVEMSGDKNAFEHSAHIFTYLTSLKPAEKVNPDTIKLNYKYMLNTTGLLPNDGRYQGFKSSGKISTIENTQLQNDVLDLYQEDIPSLIASTNNYTLRKETMFKILIENMRRRADGGTNILELLNTDQVYNVSSTLANPKEVLERYDIAINKSKKIIAAIDKEYQ